MSLVKKVFKNATYLLIARALFRFLTALVMIYAARYLTKEEYGMYGTALAWSNVFLALNDLGMSTLIVREAARDEKKMALYFGNTLVVEIILSIFFFFLTLIIGIGLHYDYTTLVLIAILSGAGLVFEFRKVARGAFRVIFEMKFVALMEIANGALYFITTILIISFIQNTNTGLLALAHTRLWVNVLVVVILLLATLRYVKPKFSLSALWPMIKQSYVFTLYNMFFMLYFQVDQIIISIMQDAKAVGAYTAPSNIVTFFLFIPLMIFQVTMPLMYRYSKDNLEQYKRINHALWRYLCAFGIPAGVGIALLAPQIMTLVYHNKYQSSSALLMVMGIFLSVRFLGISQGNSMTTTDRQGLRATIQLLSVVLNIILDIILIKFYGILGAGIATLITECVIDGTYLIYSARFLQESLGRNLLSILPVGAATVGMGLAVFLAKPYLHVIVIILLGMMVYLFLLWLLRFFKPFDKNIMRQIILKNK